MTALDNYLSQFLCFGLRTAFFWKFYLKPILTRICFCWWLEHYVKSNLKHVRFDGHLLRLMAFGLGGPQCFEVLECA